jgi:hypothetical protein
MGALYAYLVDAGYDAAYLDECTLFDLDLFTRQTTELNKKKGPKLF